MGIIQLHLAVAQHGGDFAGLGIVLSDQVIGLIGDVHIVRIIHTNVLGRAKRGLFARPILFAAFASAGDGVNFPVGPHDPQRVAAAFEHVDITLGIRCHRAWVHQRRLGGLRAVRRRRVCRYRQSCSPAGFQPPRECDGSECPQCKSDHGPRSS